MHIDRHEVQIWLLFTEVCFVLSIRLTGKEKQVLANQSNMSKKALYFTKNRIDPTCDVGDPPTEKICSPNI